MDNSGKNYRKNIWLLGIVSLLNDISSEIIAPILPILIKNLGGSGLSIGLISGMRDGLTHLLKFVFGFLSDRQGSRKPFIFFGYFTSAIFKATLAFAQCWQHILLFVSLERIGKGIRTSPRDALIAQSTPKTIGKSLGIVRSFDNIGATIGSIIVFLVMWLYKIDLKIIVFIAAIIAILAVIPLFFVEEPKHQDQSQNLSWGPLPASVKQFAIINGIFHTGNISYMFLTLRVHDFSTIFSPIQNALLMYITFNLVHAACAAPFGNIVDNVKRKNIVLIGYIFHGIVMLGFLLSKTPLNFWIFFMLYGGSLALTETSQKAFAFELSPKRRQGSAIGLAYASIGAAQIIGGLIIGLLWENISHEYIFIFSVITTLISSILGFLFFSDIKLNIPAQ